MRCIAQTSISGTVVNGSQQPLAFVNIGIKGKNFGTCSDQHGRFSLLIPATLINDTLTFSLVGHLEEVIPVFFLTEQKEIKIRLRSAPVQLGEVSVTARKPVEKKFGIAKNNSIMQIVDASLPGGLQLS
jgi:hypothetical protein